MSILHQNLFNMDMLWFKLHQKWGRSGSNFGSKLWQLKFSRFFSIPKIQFNKYGCEENKITLTMKGKQCSRELFSSHLIWMNYDWILGIIKLLKNWIFVQIYCQTVPVFTVVWTKMCPYWTCFEFACFGPVEKKTERSICSI